MKLHSFFDGDTLSHFCCNVDSTWEYDPAMKTCQISAHLCPSLHLPIHQKDSVECTKPSHWKTSGSHGSGCPDLIQVSRDLKMTYQTKLDLIQVLRDLKMTYQTKSDLIQVSRDLKMTYPSILRLENDLSNKNQTSSKSRET